MLKTWKKFAISTPPILLAMATIIFPVIIAQTQANEDYRKILAEEKFRKELDEHYKKQMEDLEAWGAILKDDTKTPAEKQEAREKLKEFNDRYTVDNLKFIPEHIGRYLTLATKYNDYFVFGVMEIAFKKGTLALEEQKLKDHIPWSWDRLTIKDFLWRFPIFKEYINKVLKESKEGNVKLNEMVANLLIDSIDSKMKSFKYKKLCDGCSYDKYEEENKYYTEAKTIMKWKVSGILNPGENDPAPTEEDIKLAKIWKPILDQSIN